MMATNMKKQLAAVALCAGIAGGSALAASGLQTIRVQYDNIKATMDGSTVELKDANGNKIEPFIYKGMTYLPVRAVANALNIKVEWDGATSTVKLGSTSYEWLDQMPYENFEASGESNEMTSWSKFKTVTGKTYERGLQFHLNVGSKADDSDPQSSYATVTYQLSSQYSRFAGTLVHRNGSSREPTIVAVMGDGKTLYSSAPISKGFQDAAFDIDVSGVNTLTIRVYLQNANGWISATNDIGIVDAKFMK